MAAPSVTSRAPTSAAVTWAPVKEQGGPCRQYHLQLDASAAGGGGDPVTCYRGPACAFQAQGLAPGAAYAVRVAAENDAGVGPWSQYTKFVTRPAAEVRQRRLAAPTGLTLEKATRSSLKLRWRAGAGGGDSGGGGAAGGGGAGGDGGASAAGGEGGAAAAAPTFRVEVAEGSGSFEAVYTGSATECTAKRLRPDCRYRVRVQAVGRAGPGPYGPEESFRTLPASRSLLMEVLGEARVQMAAVMLLIVLLLVYITTIM